MYFGQGGFKDPDQFEIKFFVAIAVAGLLVFYTFGCYTFAKKDRPVFEKLAQAVFDPGTAQVRYIWFPPKYLVHGQYHGYPAYLTTFTDGRRRGRDEMIQSSLHHDFFIKRGRRPHLPPELYPALAPLLQLNDLQELTLRSGRNAFWKTLSDGRPTTFGQKEGVFIRRMNPALDASSVRGDLDLLLQVARSGI